MGEIGAGNGSAYPSAYDTDNTVESNSTFVRYQVPNDLAACILAIEQTLGLNPEGSYSTVATRLDDAVEDWRRTGTTLSPFNLNDNVQISGTLSVSGTTTTDGLTVNQYGDSVTITNDGSDAYIKWDNATSSEVGGVGDGSLYLIGNAVSNNISRVWIKGNGIFGAEFGLMDGSSNNQHTKFTQDGGTFAIDYGSSTTEFVINEDSNDVDFRVESNNKTHMFFVDAGNDSIQIGNDCTALATDALVVSTLNSTSTLDIGCFDDGTATSARLYMFHSLQDTVGLTTTTTGTVLADILMAGVDSGGSRDIGAQIEAKQDGAAGTKVPTNLYLTTCSNSAENINQLVLLNEGGVFIGEDGALATDWTAYDFGVFENAAYNTSIFACYSDTNSHRPSMLFFKSHSDTMGTNAALLNGEAMGGLLWQGCDTGDGVDFGASLLCFVDGTNSGSKVPTRMVLSTYSTSAENADQLVLDSDGYVGINAQPSGTFDVSDKFTVTSSGTLVAYNIPTYDTGVTGQIWNDGGTLKIS